MKTKWIKLVAVLFLFSVLFSTVHVQKTSAASIRSLVNKEVSKLKKTTLAGGFKAEHVKAAHLTGKSTPEILAIYQRFNDKTFMTDAQIRVYAYNSKTKKWSVTFSYKDYETDFYTIATVGKMLDSKKEQIVIGTVAGSGGYLTPTVIGSTDGKKIKKLISISKSYYGGTAAIKDKVLYLGASSIVLDKYYYTKGKLYHKKGTGADDRKAAGKVNRYLYLEKKNGKTVYNGSRSFSIKKGQKIAIVRKSTKDSSEYGYRILSSGYSQKLEISGFAMTAKSIGTEVWHFEPEAYGDSLTIKIKVTK
ncbi:hypothetical protein KW850_27430 [Bacillus sp. sid0103]|uniref:hypothetical protein n=1 Tax=Bacillus sp. sid0103 TaxID=2856337 RepID=UPI001C491392|nr:hypothetical protein [Bacillus sp. sid0103]MBV7508939.1 hypothetical protein [Bacillus sp. sid0103]